MPCPSKNAAKKLMNNNDRSQVTCGREGRPPSSPAFCAAWGRVVGLALLVLSAMPSYAGPTAKFSADLQQRAAGAGSMVTVIVQYRQMPTASSIRTMQVGGAAIKSKLHTIRAVTMRVPVSMLAKLAKDPNVAYITPDRPVSLTATSEDYTTAVEADVAAAQFALDGTGVGVAIIDSGVAEHGDLHDASGAGRGVYSRRFVAGDTTTSDKFGHGTHVAGLIGGTGANSGTGNGYLAKYAGVAPNVNIISLRVLDSNGSGTDSQVIAAIQQAIALQSTYNIRVINMSLGRPVYESYPLDPVCQAVESAWQAGIVVVVAAGNMGQYNGAGTSGYATIGVPGDDPYVITVGATNTHGTGSQAAQIMTSVSS